MAGYIACDAGQSSTRLRLVSGSEVRDEVGPGVDTSRELAPQWAAAIGAALNAHPDLEIDTVAVGSSGQERETADALLALVRDRGIVRVILAHDSITSYLGALGLEPGCVIAAGTGTICLAVGPHTTARVDGWGHLLGDAGSAYWIGRTALEAAMRGHDGRRQITALTDMMREEFPDLEVAYVELQSAADRVTRIAAFAGRVNELAATDRVAANILDKAAAHLSEAVFAGIRRVDLHGPQPPRVAAIGGVFASPRVISRFTDFLSLQWPAFALVEPLGGGLEGAQRLLDLTSGHPLYARLSIAEA